MKSRKTLKLFLVSLVAVGAWLWLAVPNAQAATYTVSNSNNSGGGSFRQAITDANNNGGADTIQFGIGSGCIQIIPTSQLPLISGPVTIDGTTQTGCSGKPPIELSGNGAGSGAKGFWVSSTSVTIKGFIINRWSAHGIWIDQGGTTVTGNWVGLASDGVTAAGNGDDGIGIYSGTPSFSSNASTIGGTNSADRNVISGNARNGIGITAENGGTAKNNMVIGNYIGTNSAGNGRVPNGGDGILINDADDSGGGGDVSGNTIGGTTGTTPGGGCTGSCNVISGNGVNGVGLWHAQATGIIIKGNHIGLNAGGDGTVYNGDIGIEVQESPNNTIGDSSANGRNTISGNLGAGIFLTGNSTTGNVVIGNYIGTNSAGNVGMGNLKMGVGIGYSPGILTAHHNQIGGGTGTTPTGGCTGWCNVISGNGQNGVLITGTGGNILEGNHIGMNAGGDGAIRNVLDGIGIVDSPNNTVGGGSSSQRNKISGNGDNGIIIAGGTSTGNRLEGNYIGLSAASGNMGNSGAGVMLAAGVDTAILGNGIGFNGKLGIDLNYDNVSPNDPNDGDGGVNRSQNFPSLYAAKTTGGTTRISGHFNSNPSGSYRLDFFSSSSCNGGKPFNFGEGQTYLGSSDITTDVHGNKAFGFTPSSAVGGGNYITATATKKIGNVAAETSEFSQCILVNIDKPGLTDGATWLLKYDLTTGSADKTFGYGFPAQWLMCAWDADQPGVRLPVVYYEGSWFMRSSYTTGTADRTFSYGSSSDTPVCGDWNSDGIETIGVVKPGMNWDLRDSNSGGAPNYSFHFGGNGARPVAGDWDGDGDDTIGVVDGNNTWNLRNSLNDGPADAGNFHYGSAFPVVGDWDGNGQDTIGDVSNVNGFWALKNTFGDGAAPINFQYTCSGCRPLIW